ncbi:MAG TPA: beta-propeller domain-containing protein, partial [Polyangiaceae bacterium]|nr:beta-propeller domain-containing protein [Polyangiaceae bacterium]
MGLLGVLAGWACVESEHAADRGPDDSVGDTDFESEHAADQGPDDGVGDTDFVSSAGPNGVLSPAPGSPPSSAQSPRLVAPAPVPEGTDPSGAIADADVVELSGDRLYALSRYRGLSVIDVSDPAAPRLLGEHRTGADPVEMYVEDGLVYALFYGSSAYRCDDASTCSWDGTSRAQALDTRDPANIQVLADLEVPGYIAESRRVGDVLYLATRDRSFATTLTSFDVSDPTGLTQLAQLSLTSPDGQRASARTMLVTDQRIYLAGIDESSSDERPASTVQVVDTSGGAGALQAGARFDVAGVISAPWQLDEHDGVLRVVTGRSGEANSEESVVETFRVGSSTDIQPLGSLVLPSGPGNGSPQSALFDGARGFVATDWLFTLDLSDPANPRQMGQVEAPLGVHHMVPFDGRLFVLGHHLYGADGMLSLSLFDVENLAAPQRLSRVGFGEAFTGASNVETQVAHTFSVLAEQNLVVVPFGGNYFFKPCGEATGSGIQLIDFTDTTLTRRGAAPQVGYAQRALWHRDHLFAVGDNFVQAFDIANRDVPVVSGRLEVVRSASSLSAVGDRVLRFGTDWSTGRSTLDTTSLGQASDATPATELDLSALAAESCKGDSDWTGQIFMHDGFAYLPHRQTNLSPEGASTAERLAIHVLDVTDRSAPRFVGEVAVEATTGETFATVLQTNGALLIGRRGPGGYSYDIFDLAEPSAPVLASRFEVPAELSGWAAMSASLSCTRDRNCNVELTDGDIVASQHAELLEGTTQAKYYLDRIDVSDPHAPRLLPPINVPGVVIHFDSATGTIVTRDLQERVIAASSSDDCYGRGIASDSGTSCRTFPVE